MIYNDDKLDNILEETLSEMCEEDLLSKDTINELMKEFSLDTVLRDLEEEVNEEASLMENPYTKREKYNKVRKIIYEQCDAGYIDEDTKEVLLEKARSYFYETNNKSDMIDTSDSGMKKFFDIQKTNSEAKDMVDNINKTFEKLPTSEKGNNKKNLVTEKFTTIADMQSLGTKNLNKQNMNFIRPGTSTSVGIGGYRPNTNVTRTAPSTGIQSMGQIQASSAPKPSPVSSIKPPPRQQVTNVGVAGMKIYHTPKPTEAMNVASNLSAQLQAQKQAQQAQPSAGVAAASALSTQIQKQKEAAQREINKTNAMNAAADAVISGKYGNGPERIAALQRDGYDPAEIQKLVNQKLKG